MKNKKKIILTVISIVLVLAIVASAIALYVMRYAKDKNDTEELFRKNVEAVNYENTIETAYPQTDLYDIIDAHFKAELPEGKTEKKAIILGYDGCRADILAERKKNGAVSYLLENGGSNNLLYCGGVNYPQVNTQDTSTAPGWCSILTGVWADVHGITGNDITKSLDTKILMTTLVEDGVIDDATFFTKWKGHFSRNNATYLAEKDYCEENKIDVSFNLCDNDEASHEAVMAEVKSSDCSDFVFVIYEHTDSTGHNLGFTFNNPKYKEAFKAEDACAYQVIKAIEAREAYETEDWLIIVTSDHGGIGTNHGGESIQERMTFAVMNKEWE